MDDIKIGGLTADEWEAAANPQPATQQQLSDLGIIEQPQQKQGGSQQPQQKQPHQQQPDEREYEHRGYWGTVADEVMASGVELSHFFVPKSMEWNYTPRTKAGAWAKTYTKYLFGLAGLLISGEEAGVGKAAMLANGASKTSLGVRALGGIEAIAKGNKFFKTSAPLMSLKGLGVGALNLATQGTLQGAILDATLHDPEDGRLVDMLGDTDNKFIDWLQTDDNESTAESKFKNVVDGAIFNMGLNSVFSIGGKLLGGMFKNIKALSKGGLAPEEAAQVAQEIVKDNVKLSKIADTTDLAATVKQIMDNSDDPEEAIIQTMHPENIEDAQKMLKIFQDGDEIAVHDDGTFDIKVTQWQDAQKVSPEEFKRQLAEQDALAAQADASVREGDTAIDMQNQAVHDTWVQRGWHGENENLTQPKANAITKNYKDKWNLPNNIKVEMVDGLQDAKGNPVEGRTLVATNQGKKVKTPKNPDVPIRRQEQKVADLEDKKTMLEGGNAEVQDPLDRINNIIDTEEMQLKDVKAAKKNNGKIHPDITIKIDKNARNPYAALRAELEHARDVATGAWERDEKGSWVQKGEWKGEHFSRYEGANEAEIAPDYVYHKSVKRAEKVGEREVAQTVKEDSTATNKTTAKETKNLKFEEGTPDGWGDKKLNATDEEGNNVGYVEYTVAEDGTLTIDEVMNTSHGESYYTKGVAKQLIDKVLEQNPEVKKIHWDAATPEGMSFKAKYLEEHPELKGKVEGVSKYEELDKEAQESYDEMLRRKNENSGSEPTGSGEDIQGEGHSDNTTENAGAVQSDKQEGVLEEPVVSSDTRNNERGQNTNNSQDVVVQKKTDFNNTINNATTTGDIVDGVLSGKAVVSDTEDVGNLLKRTIELTPEISGTTWADIAADSDKLADAMIEAQNLGLDKDLQEALSMGDIETMDMITRKVMAAQRLKSDLGEKLISLGADPPLKDKKAIMDMIDIINRYTKETGSASGRNLEARKFINKAVKTFGNLRLAPATMQGITKLADLLVKEINDVLDLNFTRGKKLTPDELMNEFMNRFMKKKDNPFVIAASKDENLAKDLQKIIGGYFGKGSKADTEGMVSKLTDAITEARYNEAYAAALLAEDGKHAANVVSKWIDDNGGLTSFYVHNLLSGIGTLERNIVSGIFNTLYYPARKILAGVLGGGEAMSKEGWYTYQNLFSSMKECWSMCKQAFIKGEGTLNTMADTMALAEGETFQGFRDWKFDVSTPEGAWHALQNFHSIMTRAMGASDEFLKQQNYRAILRGKSMVKAEELAVQFGIKDEKVKAQMADTLFKDGFDSSGRPLDLDAYSEAKDILYQTPLDGKMYDPRTGLEVQVRPNHWATQIGQSANALAAKNGLMKVMFTFIKTGVNILQQNLEHNAVYCVLSTSQRELLKSHTRAGYLARAQVTFGFFSWCVGALAAVSGLVTGSAPADPKERAALFATGWKPYSVRFGDKYVSYAGYEPIQTILGFAADSVNILSAIRTSDDEKKYQQLTQQVMATLVNNFLDKASFRTGLRQLTFLTSPDENEDNFIRALAQTAQGFLPDSAMVRGLFSSGNRDMTAPNTPYERVFNNYFNRGLGDYRRDVFGNRQDAFGLLFPVATNISPDNASQPEYEELEYLAQFGFNPAEISETISKTGLKYKDFKDPNTGRSIYDAMQEQLSTVKKDGKTLQEAVRALVTSPEYQELPLGVNRNGVKYTSTDNTQLNAIRNVFIEYNNLALQSTLKEYGDLYLDSKKRTMREAIDDVNSEKIRQMTEDNLGQNIGHKIKRFGQ